MLITLIPLAAADRNAAIRLSVHPEQEDFVATNEESIEEADENPECVPFVIQANGVPVGFAMYALDSDDNQYWIYRLMIDVRFQGRGYGRMALEQLVHLMSEIPDCWSITLSYHPDNHGAAALYRRFGFRETGDVINDEVVMKYPVAARKVLDS